MGRRRRSGGLAERLLASVRRWPMRQLVRMGYRWEEEEEEDEEGEAEGEKAARNGGGGGCSYPCALLFCMFLPGNTGV